MPPTGDAYEIDWVLSNTSNIHIANHRDWFTNYAPIETFFEHAYASSSNIKALGIGTVQLEVRTHRSKDEYRTLTLQNVLYCPTANCNVIGEPIFDTFPQWSMHDLRTDDGEIGMIFDIIRGLSGEAVRQKVWLKGHRQGISNHDPNTVDAISAIWSDEEISRCQKELEVRSQAQKAARQSRAAAEQEEEQRYTEVERQWLKEHYRSEFFFLRDHGLSVYEEGERDEGRDILRALMERDPAGHVCKRRRVGG
ncbi:hypothetical protein CLAFUW4_11570 [Fulvia fulva]|uniref:Retrovirus-related Pol polyprotein from transposon TNT 1-94-like beta-barrel domain-containing protein n=1 Tax=Passalora fulva TaxID=5499 RepID=A0A9Q8PBR3_PASFU|nr:uncharacterized protein CLAFUR5_10613 [Fulvia fulva]KAK4620869.1 hypothetical protein CLAFUR0_11584 [Fulvia fulva]UJO19551.1 hypothetical protein CLAFUR5_10613 [Fulvia fulva]WPV17337.1 hypothetical protein CLAFUW4_11570 [Fulvia fulva]WPV32063.1 hypothetical protein CLAFUW7_11574 [Fulvia fulva]